MSVHGRHAGALLDERRRPRAVRRARQRRRRRACPRGSGPTRSASWPRSWSSTGRAPRRRARRRAGRGGGSRFPGSRCRAPTCGPACADGRPLDYLLTADVIAAIEAAASTGGAGRDRGRPTDRCRRGARRRWRPRGGVSPHIDRAPPRGASEATPQAVERGEGEEERGGAGAGRLGLGPAAGVTTSGPAAASNPECGAVASAHRVPTSRRRAAARRPRPPARSGRAGSWRAPRPPGDMARRPTPLGLASGSPAGPLTRGAVERRRTCTWPAMAALAATGRRAVARGRLDRSQQHAPASTSSPPSAPTSPATRRSWCHAHAGGVRHGDDGDLASVALLSLDPGDDGGRGDGRARVHARAERSPSPTTRAPATATATERARPTARHHRRRRRDVRRRAATRPRPAVRGRARPPGRPGGRHVADAYADGGADAAVDAVAGLLDVASTAASSWTSRAGPTRSGGAGAVTVSLPEAAAPWPAGESQLEPDDVGAFMLRPGRRRGRARPARPPGRLLAGVAGGGRRRRRAERRRRRGDWRGSWRASPGERRSQVLPVVESDAGRRDPSKPTRPATSS